MSWTRLHPSMTSILVACVLLMVGSTYGTFISAPTRSRSVHGTGFGRFDKEPAAKTTLFAESKNTGKTSKGGADFEFQELKVQLQAMKQQGIRSRDLIPEKRLELSSYIATILQLRPSPVPLQKIGGRLPQTKWTLVFSTEGATMGDLPADATIQLEFFDTQKLDYILQFSQKTMGLNRLVAKSLWSIDSGPVNPGLVTFVYDKITTDVFGLSNLPVGFFGLLKGRANYVESSYFDDQVWIERGFSPEGAVYYNVYLRDEQNVAKDA